jgi:hypothetical protein
VTENHHEICPLTVGKLTNSDDGWPFSKGGSRTGRGWSRFKVRGEPEFLLSVRLCSRERRGTMQSGLYGVLELQDGMPDYLRKCVSPVASRAGSQARFKGTRPAKIDELW